MSETDGEQPLLDLPDLPTDIDHLMSLNPLGLTPAARDAYLDGVIAYHRNIRAAKEQGVKVPKGKRGSVAKAESGEARPKLTLESLGIKAAPKATIQRRV